MNSNGKYETIKLSENITEKNFQHLGLRKEFLDLSQKKNMIHKRKS